MKHFSRKQYRVFITIYIDYHKKKKLAGNPAFFKYRLNSKNWRLPVKTIERWGFKVNAVYISAWDRRSQTTVYSERMVY
jgi:hypothetical protein